MKAKSEKQILVEISWGGRGKPTTALLDDLEDVIENSKYWPCSLDIPGARFLEALELLSDVAAPEMGELDVNGVEVGVAKNAGGGFCFVPREEHPEVEMLAHGSASWLPGGPCLMEQRETIFRLGDLYWVSAEGDTRNHCVKVGRFHEEAEGLKAAVSASTYFSFDDEGDVVCELDDWPQED